MIEETNPDWFGDLMWKFNKRSCGKFGNQNGIEEENGEEKHGIKEIA